MKREKKVRQSGSDERAGWQTNNSDMPNDPEHKRTRKPGSQGNSSKRHNNGRGGGK